MNERDLIVKQQLTIEGMQERLDSVYETISNIQNMFYCVTGPLNGNKLGYSNKQLTIFIEISKALDRLAP